MISTGEVTFYREHGYVVLHGLLDAETLDDLRREMAVALDGARAVSDHHAHGYFCGAVDPATIAAEAARAVPLTGAAGSMSFHHVRMLHGSAQNVSSLPRALLLYEFAAADAWPLRGVPDLAEFDAQLV